MGERVIVVRGRGMYALYIGSLQITSIDPGRVGSGEKRLIVHSATWTPLHISYLIYTVFTFSLFAEWSGYQNLR